MATKITTAEKILENINYILHNPDNNTEWKDEEKKENATDMMKKEEKKILVAKKPVVKLPSKTEKNKQVKVPIAKKITPKQAAKKVTVKVSVNKTENDKPKQTRGDEYKLATSLILEKKYTDAEMLSLLSKTNPERDKKQILKCISACRYFLNAGARKCYDPKKYGKIKQLVEISGKKVSYSRRPKIEKKKEVKKQVSKDIVKK